MRLPCLSTVVEEGVSLLHGRYGESGRCLPLLSPTFLFFLLPPFLFSPSSTHSLSSTLLTFWSIGD